ncbi:MAG: hypothetical protein ACNS61_00860 [Candidatus Wenzhouxiangella sp. M2_3B_020]
MADDLSLPPPPGMEPLVDAIRRRCGSALRAVVLYGSTRRSENPADGLVDLMAVVSDYRSMHGSGPAALMNFLLPPNVYYLEAGPDERRIRCKWIVVSERSLRRRTEGGFDAYFWARFTQPCRCLWAADSAALRRIARLRAAAARRFAIRAAGLGRASVTAEAFWIRAISATYGCELRPEPPGAARGLVERDQEFWRELSAGLLPEVPGILREGEIYRVEPGRARVTAGRAGWLVRRAWSRMLHVVRLLKAAGTFANGVDYLCWKIERHSGVRVEPTERMRRHPRLAAWGLMWRLWRSRALK